MTTTDIRAEMARTSLVCRIRQMAPLRYIVATARGEFDFTGEWYDLPLDRLQHLQRTITQRQDNHHAAATAERAQTLLPV